MTCAETEITPLVFEESYSYVYGTDKLEIPILWTTDSYSEYIDTEFSCGEPHYSLTVGLRADNQLGPDSLFDVIDIYYAPDNINGFVSVFDETWYLGAFNVWVDVYFLDSENVQYATE